MICDEDLVPPPLTCNFCGDVVGDDAIIELVPNDFDEFYYTYFHVDCHTELKAEKEKWN